MQFVIKNLQKSVNDIMRQIGYQATYLQKEGKFSMVRKLAGNDYPRFHLYIRKSFGPEPQNKLNTYVFNLHLDQKKPSYEGSTKHSGEYDGDVVESEAERIKSLLK